MTDDDQKQRMAQLEAKIDAAKKAKQPKPRADADVSGGELAWRMVIEMVSGLGIGFGIGYGLDSLFGTIPIFLVLFHIAGPCRGREGYAPQRERGSRETSGCKRGREGREGLNVATETTAAEGSSLVFHPMDQFIVKPLFGDGAIAWYTPTNVTLWLFLAIAAIFALLVLSTSKRAIVPTRMQSVAELAYGFIYKMLEDICGKEGVKYFPYVMTLFMFIVCANFLGMLPMSFTTTSHFAVTIPLALSVFLTVTVLGFVKNGAGFLGLFWVSSAPLALRPVLAIIELISYFVRPVSHSIRLAGNVMAGHAVIKVFAGFAAIAAISPVSVLAITAMYGLEVLVSFIQAYVFTILTCVYLKDALHPSH